MCTQCALNVHSKPIYNLPMASFGPNLLSFRARELISTFATQLTSLSEDNPFPGPIFGKHPAYWALYFWGIQKLFSSRDPGVIFPSDHMLKFLQGPLHNSHALSMGRCGTMWHGLFNDPKLQHVAAPKN